MTKGMDCPAGELVKERRSHHFTRLNLLLEAREADPDLGFMVRWLMLGTLPRSNPSNREKYVRHNSCLAPPAKSPQELPSGGP